MKGERSPFDSAVIVNLPNYRMETAKLKAAQNVLNGYDLEIGSMRAEINLRDSITAVQHSFLQSKDRVISNKDTTIERLNKQFVEMAALAARPQQTWWMKNKIWVGLVAGLVGGYLITK